ncbi:hypothetical protein ACU686_06720 [Yinghuangia aomiensis]
MTESQDHAAVAALNYLKLDPNQVKVKLNAGEIGGPSAGLMFSSASSTCSAPRTSPGPDHRRHRHDRRHRQGRPHRRHRDEDQGRQEEPRDRVPAAQGRVQEAKAAAPGGLRLVPVETLPQAVDALLALQNGGKVPSC